ncbi:hypothetical protein IJ117_02670 [Candidatus Saccharibacteria bacterium]|nr:hypothetical protein [Candidatus Saccharibacteria bacterium]
MENQEKRTLTSEELETNSAKSQSRSMRLALICAIAIVMFASGLFGTFLVKYDKLKTELKVANVQNQLLERKIEHFTEIEDALPSEQIAAISIASSSVAPREPEPVKDYPELTKTYRYEHLADIPGVAPRDEMLLWIKVDRPCRRSAAGTVLATYTHPAINTKITIAVPELGELSADCEKFGYSIISVLAERLDTGDASLKVFAFNPVEEPFIEIWVTGSRRIYANMDVQVWSMSFYSSEPIPDGDTYYRSCGVSQSNYRFFGGSNSGNDDYYFNAFSVVPVGESDDWCKPLEWSKESVEKYRDYWAKNSQFILERRSFFNADRSEFDLISYLKTTNVELKDVSIGKIEMWRPGGDELVIMQNSDSENDSARITINGNSIGYVSGYSARINGLPTRVTLPNGMKLTCEQLQSMLKFIENPS